MNIFAIAFKATKSIPLEIPNPHSDRPCWLIFPQSLTCLIAVPPAMIFQGRTCSDPLI